jgi:hypothetical protein
MRDFDAAAIITYRSIEFVDNYLSSAESCVPPEANSRDCCEDGDNCLSSAESCFPSTGGGWEAATAAAKKNLGNEKFLFLA